MHEIIDVASNVAAFANRLSDAGVRTVIRYYNHRNGEHHPSKCLTRRELRSGPGENFAILDTLARGTIVTGIGRTESWIKVDVQGDGYADGYMFHGFLETLSGGLPPPPTAGARPPIEFARDELRLGVAELPGQRDNPQIMMYHQTTRGGARDDETAWCSSFVNYCVRQAGLHGTDDKWALSWHEQGFGQDVTEDPREGDIVVFRRRSPTETGGHVGFFIGQQGDKIQILGGNQGDRVSMAPFPRDGTVGSTHYTMLSIRRPISTSL
jgi:uncharacterized protein (TIGR02594 family)